MLRVIEACTKSGGGHSRAVTRGRLSVRGSCAGAWGRMESGERRARRAGARVMMVCTTRLVLARPDAATVRDVRGFHPPQLGSS